MSAHPVLQTIILASTNIHTQPLHRSLCLSEDPDMPFLPPLLPFGHHVLKSPEEMEVPCRVSDPSSHVTLFHLETQQVVPATYDSKTGFVGNFAPGTYVCQALVSGEHHESEEYIVHGWIGKHISVCVCVCNMDGCPALIKRSKLCYLFFYLAGSGLHVELKAEKKALLVGETIRVNCVAKGSDLLEQHWKYPGRIVRDKSFNNLS